MYTARHARWLGPSGYIQAYPTVYPKPTFRMRLAVWRRYLSYALVLAIIPVISVSGVNLYAGTMVVPVSDIPAISPEPIAPISEPPVSTPSTLAISTLPPVGSEADPGLKEILNNWEAKNPKHKWGVVVQGLGEETRFAKLNPDESFRSASLFKLQLMYPLLQKHPYGSWDNVNTSAGKLSNCVTRMLKVSDNPCGEAVGAYLNWAKSTKSLKDLELSKTNLSDKGGPTSTAGDMALFMSQLYSGDKFSPEGRDYVLSTLRNQTWRKGIPTGCSGCTVANKTGDLGFVRHDAAIIEHSGGAYVLTIFTSGATYNQIAQLTAQIHSYMSKPYSL